MVYRFIQTCCAKILRYVGYNKSDVLRKQATNTIINKHHHHHHHQQKEIVFQVGHSATKPVTAGNKSTVTQHATNFKREGDKTRERERVWSEGEEEVGDNFDLKGSRLRYDPALLLRVLWNFVRSKSSVSRLARMVYDWVYMRDCLVELQLCSQQHFFLVKLVCLRIFPCLVIARLFLIHVPGHLVLMSSGSGSGLATGTYSGGLFSEFFCLLFLGKANTHGDDGHYQAESDWCTAGAGAGAGGDGSRVTMPLWLVLLIMTLKTILSPIGSFLSTCIFTLMILCLPN